MTCIKTLRKTLGALLVATPKETDPSPTGLAKSLRILRHGYVELQIDLLLEDRLQLTDSMLPYGSDNLPAVAYHHLGLVLVWTRMRA